MSAGSTWRDRLTALSLALCAAVGAALVAYALSRGADREPSAELRLADAAPPMPQGARGLLSGERIDPARNASGERTGADVDLASMAETFRRAALVTAIRDAGFICDDVAEAIQTTTDVWVATCRNMINYRVDVTDDRSLVARPVASYFDQIGPAQQILFDDRFGVDPDLRRVLPEQLRQK